MKGFPPLEMLLIAVLFGAALIPLIRLTGESAHRSSGTPPLNSSSQATAAKEDRPQIAGTIRFSHPATSFSITPDDQPATSEHAFFWSGHSDGCELHLTAAWPEGTAPVAIEVTVEPEGVPTQSRTLWADNPLDDYLTFSWQPASTASDDR